MALIDAPSVTYRARVPLGHDGAGEATVVCLHGEHDISTVAALTGAIAEAIATVDADLVLDLSDVQFMGAATAQVMIRARDFLGLRSRSLTLRTPSPAVRRVLELCGLADLVDPGRVETTQVARLADALGTWVAVPATRRPDRTANKPEQLPGRGPRPVHAGHASTPSRVPSADHRPAAEHATNLAVSGGP